MKINHEKFSSISIFILLYSHYLGRILYELFVYCYMYFYFLYLKELSYLIIFCVYTSSSGLEMGWLKCRYKLMVPV